MDPFGEDRDIIHIRVQQRNGRKCLTLVSGLADDLDLKKILRYLKKNYNTNGNVISDPQYGEIIQLQGDQRKNVYDAFVEWKVAEKEEMRVHGG